MEKVINYFTAKQKTLFLIDSIGAFITACSLFVIVRQFNVYFGMPKNELTFLAIAAVCFCIYSATCCIFLKGFWRPFLRFIGIANLLYCTLTIGLLIKNYPMLTILGTSYFLIEMVIICGLSYVEITVANRNKEKDKVIVSK